MKKAFKILGYTLLALTLILVIAYFKYDEKRPVGEKGEKAEALAQKMIQAVNKTAWDSTAIISWKSRIGNLHLWDKKRNLAQIEWKNYKVLLNINTISGKVWDNQIEVRDTAKARELIQKAYKFFINDAYWLNPVVKVYDADVERSVVTLENGKEALLVHYASGGLTPGDSYLWILDANGLPKAWKLWVKVLPLGGIETTWENWLTLPTGAKVATMHQFKGFGMAIPITDIKAAMNWTAYGLKEDPFLPIL